MSEQNLETLLGYLIALLLGVLVYADASKIQRSKYTVGSPIGWGIGTFLLSILVLPTYLFRRKKLMRLYPEAKKDMKVLFPQWVGWALSAVLLVLVLLWMTAFVSKTMDSESAVPEVFDAVPDVSNLITDDKTGREPLCDPEFGRTDPELCTGAVAFTRSYSWSGRTARNIKDHASLICSALTPYTEYRINAYVKREQDRLAELESLQESQPLIDAACACLSDGVDYGLRIRQLIDPVDYSPHHLLLDKKTFQFFGQGSSYYKMNTSGFVKPTVALLTGLDSAYQSLEKFGPKDASESYQALYVQAENNLFRLLNGCLKDPIMYYFDDASNIDDAPADDSSFLRNSDSAPKSMVVAPRTEAASEAGVHNKFATDVSSNQKIYYVTGLDPNGDNFLALRSDIDRSAVRLKKLAPNERLYSSGEISGRWLKVKTLDGVEGWVASEYTACCIDPKSIN